MKNVIVLDDVKFAELSQGDYSFTPEGSDEEISGIYNNLKAEDGLAEIKFKVQDMLMEKMKVDTDLVYGCILQLSVKLKVSKKFTVELDKIVAYKVTKKAS